MSWAATASIVLLLCLSYWLSLMFERRLHKRLVKEVADMDERRAARLAESDAIAKETLAQLKTISHHLWEQNGARKGHWR